MNINLTSISMRNFRKYDDAEFGFSGNTVIEAKNGTGKTTILNAFLWALTGKDADGKTESTDFLPVGAPIETTTEVSVTLDVDGVSHIYTRRMEPTFTGKGINRAYKGHTTVCAIDGVPKSVTEYGDALKSIFPVNPAMWIDLAYFCDDKKMSADERRALLIDCFGNVTDDDVFASNPDLLPLKEAKGSLSAEDFRLAQKEIEKNCTLQLGRGKTMGTLQARIDEAMKAIVSGISAEQEQAEIKRIEDEIAALSADRTDEFADKRKAAAEKLRALEKTEEARREKLYGEAMESWKAELKEITDAENKLRMERNVKDREYGNACLLYDNLSNDLAVAENDLMCILSDDYEPNEICPTCGQRLPQAMIDEAAGNYYEQRAIRQEETEKHIASLRSTLDANDDLIDRIRNRLDELDKEIDKRQKEADERKSDCPTMPLMDKKVAKQIAALQGVIDSLVAPPIDAERIARLTAELKTHQANLAQAGMNGKQKARIKELQDEQMRVNAALLEAQKMIDLCDNFIVTRGNLIENQIAGHFKTVRFELFSFYKNGEIKNSCRAMVDGKPYRILSFSQKILASADIIDGLGKHFNFKAPLFIDNCSELDSNSKYELSTLDRQLVLIQVSEEPLTLYSL